MPEAVKDLLQRAAHAHDKGSLQDADIKRGLEFGAPNRRRRETNTDNRYDASSAVAVRDAARLMHSTVTPMHLSFVDFEPGRDLEQELKGGRGRAVAGLPSAGVTGQVAMKRAKVELDHFRETLFYHINGSNFHDQVASSYRSERVAAGALFCSENTDPRAYSAFSFEDVPIEDIDPELGPDGNAETVWRDYTIEARMIERVWPDVNMSRTLASMVQSDQGGGFGEVELKIGTVYDPAAMAWDFLVIYPGDEAVIVERRLKSNPWIIFSSDSAPGEPLGRGPVLDVLPDIKTADKIVELLLKHQSIAVHGMWQADDDGILNPYDVKFRPGAIFPKAVGSAGLRRLEAPGDFRDAVALLAELRQRARYMIFGPELPPMDSRAMTATEVEQRRQEANLIRAPENLRVWMRLVVPLVKWAVSVLARRGEMPFLPVHNGRLLKSMPSSPLVRMQKMGIVVDGLNAYQLAASIGPEGAAQAADPARVSRWVLEMAGFPADLLNDDAQIASQQQQAQMAAALQQGSEILKNVGQSGLVDGRPAAAAPTLATLFGAGQ